MLFWAFEQTYLPTEWNRERIGEIMANFTNLGNRTTYEEFYCYVGVDGKHQQAFILTLSIIISVTAFLGNALIIAALPKVSSIHSSSKLLLSCLVWSDLSVGLISEPLYITFLLSQDDVSLCYYFDIIYTTTSVVFCGVSIQTITAISVDRLLALSLGLRYKQIVTIRRVRVVLIMSWLFSIAASLTYLFNELLIHTSITCIGLIICVAISTFCYTKIYLTLRRYHAQVHDNIHEDPPSEGKKTPLNMARYRKTVSSVLWVQMSLVICYLPYGLVTILTTVLEMYPPSLDFLSELTFSLLMFNSSLNPILYCWKITDVRQAAMETIRKCLHLSS